MRVIAYVNRKGGVGKSATADKMAACLAQKGNHVLVVDLDPQGGSTVQFGLDKRSLDGKTIYESLLGLVPLSEVIRHTSVDRVDIAPANTDLDGAKTELDNLENGAFVLKKLLGTIDGYDYIILDSEPGMSVLILNALIACDEVIVPVQPEYKSLEATADFMETLDLLKEHTGLQPKKHFVITMYSRSNHTKAAVKELRDSFGDEVFKTIIPRNIAVAKAPSFGKPVVGYDPTSSGAEAYIELTEEFLNG